MKKFNFKPDQYNPSVIIALLAVLIGSASAFISLKESMILKGQQEIMLSQKEASVWPYMEKSHSITIMNDSFYIVTYTVTNKGVGPAIIDSVYYGFREIEFKNWEFSKILKELFPNLKIQNLGNAELSNRVLTAQEESVIFKISLKNSNHYNDATFNILVNEIAQSTSLRYCYCSVYGNCWKVSGDRIERSEECSFRKEIR